VVYGDNAAGKTGYIRILKSACRARRQEQILGNVVSGAAPLSPVVSIKYEVGTEPQAREWAGNGEDEFISRVSVFDTQCAAVYLSEKTDVAFRPFGLDLFDKLVKTCKAVRAKLEGEQRALNSNALVGVQAQIPQGTAAARLLASVSSLTRPETVQALARLSPEEEARLALLEKSLLDLQANDPEKLATQLNLRAGRVRALARHLKEVEAALSAQAVADVIAVRTEGYRKSEEARRLREATFPAGMLTGTVPKCGLPFGTRRFALAQDIPGFFDQVEKIKTFDFETLVAGHVARTGTRADVDLQSEFMKGLKAAAGAALKSTRVGIGVDPRDTANPWARQLCRSGRHSVRQRPDTEVVGHARRLRRLHLGSMLRDGAKPAHRLNLTTARLATTQHPTAEIFKPLGPCRHRSRILCP